MACPGAQVLALVSQLSAHAGGAGRWGGWEPRDDGAGADGSSTRRALLLSCTLALLGPLWPSVHVAADDLADAAAAEALFARLLAAATSTAQLDALAELLATTWGNGALLPRVRCVRKAFPGRSCAVPTAVCC
jgi:hypothetical protein